MTASNEVMTLIRALAVTIMGVALAGCAAGPALFGPSTGRVTGHVTVRACGGAYDESETACRVTPAPAAQVSFRRSGTSTSAVTTTNASGVYSITLDPGTYVAQVTLPKATPALTFMPDGPSIRGFSGPKTITVTAGKTVSADFTYTIQLL